MPWSSGSRRRSKRHPCWFAYNWTLLLGVTGTDHLHAPSAESGSEAAFFSDLLKVYTPRRVCMLNEGAVIWLHALSDLLIGLAYYSIPVALFMLLRRRRDLAFSGMFWMFAGFILACGTTHFLSLAALWTPIYRIDGLVKLMTALISVVTSVALWLHLPQIQALPSPSQVLKASEVAWQATFESAAVGMAHVAPDGRWLRLNDAFCRIVGYSRDELATMSFQDITHPDDLGPDLALATKILNGEIPAYTMEKRYIRKDGSEVWVNLAVSFHNTLLPGEQPYFIGVIQDISSRKAAEEQQRLFLQERERLLESERVARAEAEAASRLKDEFLATISHELRTPLNAIAGWSQILLDPKVPESDRRRGLEAILRNVRSQGQIIDDLLDMSLIISDKIRLDLRTVDLGQVVTSALTAVRPAAEAKGIRIETAIHPAAPVQGDPGRLQQVFWNLFHNAIRFTPAGESIQVVLARMDSHLEVAVSDTGEGIDPGFLPFVFDRFRQQDGSTTRRHGGLGLGLSIVKHLVELHGGSVHAMSAGTGHGATFVVRLPVISSSTMEPV